jgi:hypothetical protein
MPEPAGSRDDHPPRIIAGHEYEFVCIATPGNHYDLVLSTVADESVATRDYVVARLRDIADRIEGTP